MKIRISHTCDGPPKDVIIAGSGGGGSLRLHPLSFGQRLARDFTEVDIGDNEVLIIRPDGAKDPDGVPLKTPV